MRRLLKILAVLSALAGGVWFVRQRRQSDSWEQSYSSSAPTTSGTAVSSEFDPPPPTAPASEADPGTREVESRLDTETKYERELQSEIAERQSAAERLKDDPLNAQLSGDEPPRDTTT